MASRNWIELRFDGQGEFSPVLVEHRPAYELFDGQAFQPRVVLSIGSAEKRHFYRSIELDDASPHCAGILFRPAQLATLILDCELHNQTRVDKLERQYSSGQMVLHHHLHCNLTPYSPPHKVAQFALDMYWQLLFPFASTVLLFLDDLGGVGPVIEILASWSRRTRLRTISAPPRILVLFHWRNRTQIESFESRLRARLMCTVSDAVKNGAGSTIYLQGEKAFESVRLIPTWKAASEFWPQTEASFAARDNAGYGFSSEHLKRLLQTAILQFGQSTGHPIDFQRAVRLRNLPSPRLAETLVHFILSTKNANINHFSVMASALDLDAHPPGMHFFPPHLTFDKNYRAALSQAERSLNEDGLVNQVRERFIRFALERQYGSSARAHLCLLHEFQAAWRNCTEEEFCFVCLARLASTTLDCRHRLCGACVTICGTREAPDSPNLQVMRCPLCGQHLGRSILLQPSSSGTRVLELGGTSQSKWVMIKFLKDLQSFIGLPLPLQEHFDLVIGSGIGLYFVQTIFLEGWSLSDCQYHLKNLDDPKVDKRRSLVSFGKGLTWRMERTASCKGMNAVLIFEGHHMTERRAEIHAILRENEPDFTVRYMGGPYNVSSLKSSTKRMLSCLFYIELMSTPMLYSSPETVCVRLLCRLPPSPEMMSLIRGLHLRSARIHYRGAEAEWAIESLVTPAILARCRRGESFSRDFEVQVSAMDSEVDVRLHDTLIGEQSISNCPYKVEKLIKDQGLDCAFGRRDHRFLGETKSTAGGVLTADIEKLSEELGRFLPSGSSDTLDLE
ncbi:hypothetical protein EDB80DRAFT_721123 [Ilyonectria destructans]|nr:hypothetical protein EDB80DRAFT_721123 [Ilyonectria destructans]